VLVTTPIIRMRGASVGYGDRTVVHGVDFDLSQGEVVAVLGANGSGKSTLVKAVLGLAPVLAGSLELFGVPAERFHDRARIGYVPQRHTVGGAVPSTVREVVTSGRLPRMGMLGRPGARDRDAIAAAMATVNLGDRADSPVATLSGGQQRRALIARALAAGPDVLVMDEPTAGVDAESQRALAQTLTGLAAEGVTMLVVTHEIAALAPAVTRAVLVRDGHLEDLGTHGPAWDGVALLDHGHHHLDDGTGVASPVTATPTGWVGEPRLNPPRAAGNP
jgi:zinc transport system ATP-binding protein